jgi:hypothetical protein
MFSANISAHDIEIKNNEGVTIYYYWTNNKTELGVSFRGKSYTEFSNEYYGNIVIPETVNYEGVNYKVTSIGNNTFRNCEEITSVVIPNSITSIGEFVFSGCYSLTSIELPDNLTMISTGFFSDCVHLNSIFIP